LSAASDHHGTTRVSAAGRDDAASLNPAQAIDLSQVRDKKNAPGIVEMSGAFHIADERRY